MKDFLKDLKDNSVLLFADINSKDKIQSKNFKNDKLLKVLIGPEGDFTSNERELIYSKTNTIPFSLSNNILRTDTAVISAISLINFILK